MISVCVATYNGEKWVKEQMLSILSQLRLGDEVIVVDDCSTDSTVAILEGLNDSRVKIYLNQANAGHVATFERALGLSSGDWILLADQDDVWTPGRVELFLSSLKESPVVASNLRLMQSEGERGVQGEEFRLPPAGGWFHLRNVCGIFLGRRAYFGCAMGMRRSALRFLLPFPARTEAHDLWIALAANVRGEMHHLEAPTVLRRIHGKNLTPRTRRSWRPVLRTRSIFVWQGIVTLFRAMNEGRGQRW